METTFPLLFAAVMGFGHAFEADHLVAVSNIVTRRNNLALAIKDGIYWGLGHTSTIFLIGLLMIVGKATFLNGWFGYFEALVGLMLVVLGAYRLFQYYQNRPPDVSKRTFTYTHTHVHRHSHLFAKPHAHSHPHTHTHPHDTDHHHHVAYGVGLIHGLAGSGAMVLLVMSNIRSQFGSMAYLLIFGLGSAAGMLVAAGIFSLPFSKKITRHPKLQFGLVLLSSILCIGYGAYVLVVHLI